MRSGFSTTLLSLLHFFHKLGKRFTTLKRFWFEVLSSLSISLFPVQTRPCVGFGRDHVCSGPTAVGIRGAGSRVSVPDFQLLWNYILGDITIVAMELN